MQRLDLKTSMKYDIFWSEGQDLVKKLPSPGDRNTRYFYLVVHVGFIKTSSPIRKLRLTPGRRSLVIRPTIEGRSGKSSCYTDKLNTITNNINAFSDGVFFLSGWFSSWNLFAMLWAVTEVYSRYKAACWRISVSFVSVRLSLQPWVFRCAREPPTTGDWLSLALTPSPPQTRFVTRPLLRSSPLTKSLKQARLWSSF